MQNNGGKKSLIGEISIQNKRRGIINSKYRQILEICFKINRDCVISQGIYVLKVFVCFNKDYIPLYVYDYKDD